MRTWGLEAEGCARAPGPAGADCRGGGGGRQAGLPVGRAGRAGGGGGGRGEPAAALWTGSLGRGRRAQPGRRGFVRGAHPPERHSWARRPAPWGRLAAGSAARGRWAARLPALDPWEPSLAGGGGGFGNRPGGRGRVQTGRGPWAPADGWEAGLGPGDKGSGQMFAARCSRDGGSLGKPSLLSRRPPPAAAEGVRRARCGWGVHRRGTTGKGETRRGLRASLGQVVYLSARPHPSHFRAVKYGRAIWAELPVPCPPPASLRYSCGSRQVDRWACQCAPPEVHRRRRRHHSTNTGGHLLSIYRALSNFLI